MLITKYHSEKSNVVLDRNLKRAFLLTREQASVIITSEGEIGKRELAKPAELFVSSMRLTKIHFDFNLQFCIVPPR